MSLRTTLPLHLIPDVSELGCYLPVVLPIAWIAVNHESANSYWQWLCSELTFQQLTCHLPFLCAFFFYFGTSLVFFAVDMTNSFQTFKIQTKKKPPTLESYWNCAKLVLFNFFAINLPISYLNYLWLDNAEAARMQVYAALPSAAVIVRDLAVSAVLFEFSFYWWHRLFHYPPLYKIVHKEHHKYTAPMGLAAIYAHPLDHLITNMVSMILGPIFMKMHVAVLCLWGTITVITTVCTHSGYALPGSANASSHDYHHYAFNSNFGVLGIFDWLHGTDKGSKEYEAAIRRRIGRQKVAMVDKVSKDE
ncbi:hypothetical protein HDU79_007014 [Rhizoclosmatium sp. JEL0117]|nr:hypothetical protein HDU79_007014 [Rhizoclosmatium sp. JEL0117]